MNSRDIRARIAWIVGIVSAILVVALMMIPPVLGVADSGDYARVLVGAGIAPLDPNETYHDRYFGYAHSLYGYGGYQFGGYFSTHVLLVMIAGWIGRIVSSEHFDIRVLGACYTALYALAVTLLIRSVPRASSNGVTATVALVLSVCVLFVFGDLGYVVYFQSFFGEPYALIAMLLTVAAVLGLLTADKPCGAMFALFTIAALALATSKLQNAPLGFAFAALAWRMLRLRDDRRWRKQVWTGVTALVVCSMLMIVVAPDRLKSTNLYQSIFYGVLKDTPHLSADMKELGIPEKYAVNAGTNYFQQDAAIPQGDPTLHREVLEQRSHKDIALYYARHPSRFVQKLKVAADNAVYIRPGYLGNYDRSEGKPWRALSYTYSTWSSWKAEHLPRQLAFFVSFYALYYLLLAGMWLRTHSRRLRLGLETMAIVGIAGLFAVFVAIIGDGEADMGKHLFMFNVCFDLMGVSVVTAIAYGLAKLVAYRRRGDYRP